MRRPRRNYIAAAAATAAAATVGAAGTRVDSQWYRHLEKPRWQPPGWVFGPTWTALYALIAAASGRILNRTHDTGERRQYAVALGLNLTLNTGWTWLFFTKKRLDLSLIDAVVLEASTLDLLRRAARADRRAVAMLVPYVIWGAFAIALNARLLQRNR